MGTAHRLIHANTTDEGMDLDTAVVRRPVVLIVDDDEVVRAATVRLIAACSMRAIEADSGLAALELLRTQRVDMVICDQSMPKMSGGDVLSWVRRRMPHVRRVLLSGHTRADLLTSNVNLRDVDLLLYKGIRPSELQAALCAQFADTARHS